MRCTLASTTTFPKEEPMGFGDRWREIRTGFERSFWIANFTELFERLAYYGLQAVLAIYLHERLGLSEALRRSLRSPALKGLGPRCGSGSASRWPHTASMRMPSGVCICTR